MNLIIRVFGHYEPLETPSLIMIVSLIMRCIMMLLAFQCTLAGPSCASASRQNELHHSSPCAARESRCHSARSLRGTQSQARTPW